MLLVGNKHATIVLYIHLTIAVLTTTSAVYRSHLFHKQKLWFPSKRIFVPLAQAF